MSTCIVAMTGASGAVYGVRLIEELLKRGDDVGLVISPSGFLILKEELGIEAGPGDAAPKLLKLMGLDKAPSPRGGKRGGAARAEAAGRLTVRAADDLTAPVASGSSGMRAMIVCPCSMGTLARIASGFSGNLIERAADCVLKEGGRLIVVPRETPLNAIHLENMLKLARLGVTVLPAMPAFYHGPKKIDDMVDFIVGKILDSLGVENALYKRWTEQANRP